MLYGLSQYIIFSTWMQFSSRTMCPSMLLFPILQLCNHSIITHERFSLLDLLDLPISSTLLRTDIFHHSYTPPNLLPLLMHLSYLPSSLHAPPVLTILPCMDAILPLLRFNIIWHSENVHIPSSTSFCPLTEHIMHSTLTCLVGRQTSPVFLISLRYRFRFDLQILI